MGWLLGCAVLAAVGWIAAIVGGQILRGDRRARLAGEAKQLEADARALAIARPGGTADRPIEVVSASQIEPRAEREPCPTCGGRFHVETHEVQTIGANAPDAETVRHVVCRCGTCGTARTTWFRVQNVLPA